MARYEPDDTSLKGSFIEFSDSWSRAQVRAARATIPDDATADDDSESKLLACLRPKIVALHLACVDAAPITDAADLTPERTEQMDTRLYTWFAYVWMRHLNELSDLGNAIGRRLWSTSDSSPQAKPTAKSTARKSRKS